MEACGHYPWFERVLEKANSARWIGEQGLSCEWQKGSAVISVRPSLMETCKSLHSQPGAALSQRGRSKEFMTLLRKSGVAHDADRLFATGVPSLAGLDRGLQ